LIKRHKPQPSTKKYYRVNERIYAITLRVLDHEGKQIGVFPKQEALDLARKEGLDLVEVAPLASPPVVKLIDFKKFLYQEEKKRREEKKKSKVADTKEIRLGPFISENDLQVMIRRCQEFVTEGNKIRLVVKFKGREVTRSEFGLQVLRKVIAAVGDISKVDREPKMEGRQMVAILSPEKKK
jgi:translation initiation factor IF-3